jgi:cytochrome P450
MPTARTPSSPPGRLLSGNLPELRQDWPGVLARYASQYGDFVPLRLGPRRAVLVSDPELIEQVLVTDNRNFIKSPAFHISRRLFGNGLLASEGEFWLRQRRLAQPAFHMRRLAAYGQMMVEYADAMVSEWVEGETLDIYPVMMDLTLRIVAKALFDADLTGKTDQVRTDLAIGLERVRTRFSSPLFLVPDTFPLPGNLTFLRAARHLDSVVNSIIDERRARPADRGDLLSTLMHAQAEDGTGMTDQQLRDEVMTLLISGHESVAIALSWIWYLVGTHPDVEAQLVEELDRVLDSRLPGMEDLAHLPFTQMVVREALRLFPPAWAMAREAVAECQVGRYLVLAGTIIGMSSWVVQRDARFFDEPERFIPDRWANGLAERLPRFAYFPFGGGPRLCIGRGFALTEAALILATVARRFRLIPDPNHLVEPLPAVTLRPKNGVKVTLHRR